MTGIELAETIYTTYQLVTGYGDREAFKHLAEARILQKPYAEAELMEKIARALN